MPDRAMLARPLTEEIARRIPDPPGGIATHRETIAEATAIIAERFRPRRVVLYGSRVYGSPKPESDADLMVVLDSSLPPSEQRSQIRSALIEALRPPIRIDVQFRRPEQIRTGLAERDFFILDVMEHGVTLYEDEDEDAAEREPGADPASIAVGSSSPKGAVQDWLVKALLDDQLAERAMVPPPPLWDGVVFHAQQSAEKHLKAWLQQHEIRFPRTHDLVALSVLARPTGLAPLPERDDLEWLADRGVTVRYPGADASQEEGERALHVAASIRAAVRSALGLDPGGTRP